MRPGYSKSEKMDPQVSKSEAKGTKSEPRDAKSEPKRNQREPKMSQREPKVSRRDPKGSQWEPKGSQKWAKGRPKCIKKSIFGKGREKGAPGAIRHSIPRTILGAIFHQKSMKKTMRKSMLKKVWQINKFRCENGINIEQKFLICLIFFKTEFMFSENVECAKTIVLIG